MAAKPKLTLPEAAEYLGISESDLWRSRIKGMEPGSLGFKEGGVLYFRRADLPKPPKAPKIENED